MKSDYWLLPDGMDELLPPSSWHMEALRRKLLDLFRSYGYELVSPPITEYLDALLTGTGNDLDLQTFKLIDQSTGRTLGIRPDTTPQVARIDAHQLHRDEPSRYCYIGTVLRARPAGFATSRNPMQLGAELFGHQGSQSDIEIIDLMLCALEVAGIPSVSLDLGHVGIFRGLAQTAQLDRATEHFLFDALQRKAIPEIQECVHALTLPATQREAFIRLALLSGGSEVLDEARNLLGPLNIQSVNQALDTLSEIARHLATHRPNTPIHFDLAELHGYAYKTGVVFAAFVPGCGSEIARGGRYDDIGSHFGHARPATGFSADLKTWVRLAAPENAASAERAFAELIYAPCSTVTDAALLALPDTVKRLRESGRRVVSGLQGQSGTAQSMGCTHQLVNIDNQWVVKSI